MGLQTFEVIPAMLFTLLSFLMVGYYIRLKHNEKIEIIKKGDSGLDTNYMNTIKHSFLSKGIVLVSLAVGMAIGYIISFNIDGISQLIIYLICLLGSGGIGLLIYYFIIRKEE